MEEGGPNQTNDNGVQANDHDEAPEETEFRTKLRDAQTPLYSDCIKHTKVSATSGTLQIQG